MIKLIDCQEERQALANEAANRWKQTYCHGGEWQSNRPNGDTEPVWKALVTLGSTPNPDDVDRIIGNDGWTSPDCCSECGDKGPRLVHIGEEPDYEARWVTICAACLKKALSMLES